MRTKEDFEAERPYGLRRELAELEKMSEEEACRSYNVDCKDEARQCIIDYYL
jgi:hypothetical protein